MQHEAATGVTRWPISHGRRLAVHSTSTLKVKGPTRQHSNGFCLSTNPALLLSEMKRERTTSTSTECRRTNSDLSEPSGSTAGSLRSFLRANGSISTLAEREHTQSPGIGAGTFSRTDVRSEIRMEATTTSGPMVPCSVEAHIPMQVISVRVRESFVEWMACVGMSTRRAHRFMNRNFSTLMSSTRVLRGPETKADGIISTVRGMTFQKAGGMPKSSHSTTVRPLPAHSQANTL